MERKKIEIRLSLSLSLTLVQHCDSEITEITRNVTVQIKEDTLHGFRSRNETYPTVGVWPAMVSRNWKIFLQKEGKHSGYAGAKGPFN